MGKRHVSQAKIILISTTYESLADIVIVFTAYTVMAGKKEVPPLQMPSLKATLAT
jgi:hypothetical protein